MNECVVVTIRVWIMMCMIFHSWSMHNVIICDHHHYQHDGTIQRRWPPLTDHYHRFTATNLVSTPPNIHNDDKGSRRCLGFFYIVLRLRPLVFNWVIIMVSALLYLNCHFCKFNSTPHCHHWTKTYLPTTVSATFLSATTTNYHYRRFGRGSKCVSRVVWALGMFFLARFFFFLFRC